MLDGLCSFQDSGQLLGLQVLWTCVSPYLSLCASVSSTTSGLILTRATYDKEQW